MTWALVAGVGLVLANGMFVAAEFALIASRRATLVERSARWGGRWALDATTHLGRMLAGTQLGITIASLALGAVVEPAVSHTLEGTLGRLGVSSSVAHVMGVGVALGIVVLFHLIVGEMVPKSVALTAPERTLAALVVPIRLFVWAFAPLIALLRTLARWGARLLGVTPADELESAVGPAELAVMVEESNNEGVLEGEESERLAGALDLVDRPLIDVAVPQASVVSVGLDATLAEVEEVVARSGHSRILLHDGADLVGYLHVKDLLGVTADERDRRVAEGRIPIHPLMSFAPDTPIGAALTRMRLDRRHLARVGEAATLGIVSLEDLLESVVGEIRDETDRES